jgi:hypothetical protein
MPQHFANSRRHALAERGLDSYPTPSVAVEALLRVEQIPHGVYEPAAGRGAIAEVLRARGHAVITSDVVQYCAFRLDFVADFLNTSAIPVGTGAIVTNPPFRIAERLVAHALELCLLVIVLLRLALGIGAALNCGSSNKFFRDAISRREHEITGLCQACQDFPRSSANKNSVPGPRNKQRPANSEE